MDISFISSRMFGPEEIAESEGGKRYLVEVVARIPDGIRIGSRDEIIADSLDVEETEMLITIPIIQTDEPVEGDEARVIELKCPKLHTVRVRLQDAGRRVHADVLIKEEEAIPEIPSEEVLQADTRGIYKPPPSPIRD